MTEEHYKQSLEPDLLILDPTDSIPIVGINLFNVISTFHLPCTISLPPLKLGLGVWFALASEMSGLGVWLALANECQQKEYVSCPGRSTVDITVSITHWYSNDGNIDGMKPPPACSK